MCHPHVLAHCHFRVRELVRETCEAFEIRIVRGVVSKDHVHILVSCPPTMAPSEIMRRIKGRTSSKLFEEFPHLKKRYWGRHFSKYGRMKGRFCSYELHLLNSTRHASGWAGI